VGDVVIVEGRWNSDRSAFEAKELLELIPREERCVEGDTTGTVKQYVPGSFLVLTTEEQFRLRGVPEDAMEGDLVDGAQVYVSYLDCGEGIKYVQRVKVLQDPSRPTKSTETPQPVGPIQGTVITDPSAGSFQLMADNGDELTVLYEPGVTPITGQSTEIRRGQIISVMGWPDGDVITAASIEVLEDAPTPTVTPPITSTPTTVVGRLVPPVTPPSGAPTAGSPGETR
jgi:hypothetical protein